MSCFYGVWQDGLHVTYQSYDQVYGFQDFYMGTHVGNYPHMVFANTQLGAGFDADQLFDLTYDVAYCASYTASYIATYGVTYAATYYRDTACNVRALEWV